MYQLRELEKNDVQTINLWRNDKALIDCLGAPFRFINLDVDTQWFDNYMKNRSTNVRCAIVDSECPETIIGLVSLCNIDYLNRSAVLHLMIGNKENRGKGIGTFAVNEMLHHAFHNLNLHRVELSVLEDNMAAIHLYEKCGFELEGRKRQSNFKNGEYKDMLIYSILAKMSGVSF